VKLGGRGRRIAAGASVAAFAVALVAAGQGGRRPEASKPASQIAKDAYRAAVAAKTFRVSGSVSAQGQQVSVNLVVHQKQAVTGSVTLQGHAIQIVVIRSRIYVNAPAAFYQAEGASASQASEVSGHWVKLPASQAKDFVEFDHANEFLHSLAHPKGALSKAGTTTVGSVAVILVKSTTGGTLAVAARGTPYPVEFSGQSSGGSGSLTFSGWNRPVAIKAPTNFIDASK
jgi:hypothetical protein